MKKKVKTNNTNNNKADPLTISSNKNNKKKIKNGKSNLTGISIVDEDFKRVLENNHIVLSCVYARLHYLSHSCSTANFPILGKNLKDYSEIRIFVLEIKPRINKYHKNKMPPFQKFVFSLLQKSIYQNPNSQIKLKKKNAKLQNQI